jgi:serine/threonine protein kinase
MHRIIYSDPEPIATHRPDAPRDLIRIVRKALAKDPDDRYQTMKDLAIDLRELLREIESHPSGVATSGPPRPRRRWIPVAAMLAAGAIARRSGPSHSSPPSEVRRGGLNASPSL